MAAPSLLVDLTLYDRDGSSGVILNRWTLTDAERDVTGVANFDGITWTSEAVQLGDVTHNSEDSSATGTLKLRRDHPVPQLYLTGQPYGHLWVRCYRYANSVTAPIWIGKVQSVEWAGLEATINIDSLKSRAQRLALRVEYRATCWKPVYSTDAAGAPNSGCGLDRTAHTRAGTVTAISTDGRTVTTTLTDANGFYAAGLFEAAGQARMIVSNTGGVLTLLSGIDGLAVGAPVTALQGCDRSIAACQAFGNFARYGGHPTVPRQNPWEIPLSQ